MQFEWDTEKAEINLKKHGVSFAEAATVWGDYFYIDLFDEEHSFEENRYLIFGESAQKRLWSCLTRKEKIALELLV